MRPIAKDVIHCRSTTYGYLRYAEVVYVGKAKIHLKSGNNCYVTRLCDLQSITLVCRKTEDTDLGI